MKLDKRETRVYHLLLAGLPLEIAQKKADTEIYNEYLKSVADKLEEEIGDIDAIKIVLGISKTEPCKYYGDFIFDCQSEPCKNCSNGSCTCGKCSGCGKIECECNNLTNK